MTTLELLQKLHNKELTVLVYDFETDGFFTHEGLTRPIQFAAIELLPDGSKQHHNIYIKRDNSKPLKHEITSLTGLTTEFINKHGIEYPKAMSIIHSLMTKGNTLIVGHNIIGFDNKFCEQGFHKCNLVGGIDTNFVYDTGGQYKYECGDFPNFNEDIFSLHSQVINARVKGLKWNLDKAILEYNLSSYIYRSKHNAMLDVALTAILFLIQINKLGAKYNIDYEAIQLRLITTYYSIIESYDSYGDINNYYVFEKLLRNSLFNIIPEPEQNTLFHDSTGTITL